MPIIYEFCQVPSYMPSSPLALGYTSCLKHRITKSILLQGAVTVNMTKAPIIK